MTVSYAGPVLGLLCLAAVVIAAVFGVWLVIQLSRQDYDDGEELW